MRSARSLVEPEDGDGCRLTAGLHVAVASGRHVGSVWNDWDGDHFVSRLLNIETGETRICLGFSMP